MLRGTTAQWLHCAPESGAAFQSSCKVLFNFTESLLAQRSRRSLTITSARPPRARAQRRQQALAGYEKPISGGQLARELSVASVAPPGHWSNRIAVASERSQVRGAFSSASHVRLLMKRARSRLQNLRTAARNRSLPNWSV